MAKIDFGRIVAAVIGTTIAQASPTVSDQKLTRDVTTAINNNPSIAMVPVVSGWFSPTNIASVVAFLAMLGTNFGITLDPDIQKTVTTVIIGLYGIFVWYRKRTSASVTPTAAAKAATIVDNAVAKSP